MLEPNLRAHLTVTTKVAIAIIAVVTTVFAVGPKVETSILPPFQRVNSALVAAGNGHIDVIVTGVKARRCVLVSATGISTIEGKDIQSRVIMLKDDGSQLSIEEQRIGVGAPFVRLARVVPGGDNVKIVVESQCHPFWTVSQVVANIPAK